MDTQDLTCSRYCLYFSTENTHRPSVTQVCVFSFDELLKTLTSCPYNNSRGRGRGRPPGLCIPIWTFPSVTYYNRNSTFLWLTERKKILIRCMTHCRIDLYRNTRPLHTHLVASFYFLFMSSNNPDFFFLRMWNNFFFFLFFQKGFTFIL